MSDNDININIDIDNHDSKADLLAKINRLEIEIAALKNTEEHFRTIYYGSRDAFMIVTPNEGFMRGNPAVVELFGCQNEAEFISKTPAQLSPLYQPDGTPSKEKARQMMNIAMEKGAHFFEWLHKRMNGEEFLATVLLTRLEFPDKILLQGTIRDITEPRHAEEELHRLRNLLANIINSMPSVLIGVDQQGIVTQWNHEAETLTGVSATEAITRPLPDVFPQIAREMDKIHLAIQAGQLQKDTKIPEIRNGQQRFSDITIYPLSSDGIRGAVIRIDDITEQVRLEEMMIQSEKMLSVGGLAAGMAHEINNPLAGILQNIQVIHNRLTVPLDKNREAAEHCGFSMAALAAYLEKRDVLTMINGVIESGQRAAKIVENMLNFSRKSEAKFVPCHITQLIDKTIELASNDYSLKKNYDFRKIDINRQYPPDIPEVWCEPSQIQQVLFNLLKNGAEAMASRPRVETTAKPLFIVRVTHDNGLATIQVEDNGPGMTEDIRKRIFEPFFTTKEVGVGTGLGLSVSYFIIHKNHGGTLTVESTPGIGTKFIIHLPITRNQQKIK